MSKMSEYVLERYGLKKTVAFHEVILLFSIDEHDAFDRFYDLLDDVLIEEYGQDLESLVQDESK